jgi:membrane-associated phospholipid phosphatase
MMPITPFATSPAIAPIRIRWADFVSDIFSPPILWAILSPVIAFRDSPSILQGIGSAIICILFVCVLPTLYILWLYQRGVISDIYLPFPQERIRPFVFSIGSTFVAYVMARLLNLTPIINGFLLATFFQLILLLIITFFWKISTHTLAISATAALISLWFGAIPGLVFVPLIFLIAAARLRLRRHTPSEVIGGIVLGTVMVILLVHFFALV